MIAACYERRKIGKHAKVTASLLSLLEIAAGSVAAIGLRSRQPALANRIRYFLRRGASICNFYRFRRRSRSARRGFAECNRNYELIRPAANTNTDFM